MSIELCMVDMNGDCDAVSVLLHCYNSMPDGFFSRITLFAPTLDCPVFPFRFVETQLLQDNGKRQLYNVWVLREMPRYVCSDYFMVVQRDGFILNPHLWTDEFLCDYIGAPWDSKTMGGNTGFCIKSKKLADWVACHQMPINPTDNNDTFISKTIAYDVEAAGFRLAPLELKLRFALELDIRSHPRNLSDVFGFHGKQRLNEARQYLDEQGKAR